MAGMSRNRGFTLIELLVVMAIIATLLALVAPRYFKSVERSKEAVLRENINGLRDAIDKYYGDTGKYPDALDELVAKRYLRAIPVDPLTDSNDTWQLVPSDDSEKSGIYDVKSGAPGHSRSGTPYSEW